jgi:hypothetical protein
MSKQAIAEIQKLGYDARDHMLTGWNCWPKKQQLYEILWAVEKELARCPTFSPEEEWLEEHRQDEIIEKLKGK